MTDYAIFIINVKLHRVFNFILTTNICNNFCMSLNLLHLRHFHNLFLKSSSELDLLYGFMCEPLPVSTDLQAAAQGVLI